MVMAGNLEEEQGIKAIKPDKSNCHLVMLMKILWSLKKSPPHIRCLTSARRRRAVSLCRPRWISHRRVLPKVLISNPFTACRVGVSEECWSGVKEEDAEVKDTGRTETSALVSTTKCTAGKHILHFQQRAGWLHGTQQWLGAAVAFPCFNMQGGWHWRANKPEEDADGVRWVKIVIAGLEAGAVALKWAKWISLQMVQGRWVVLFTSPFIFILALLGEADGWLRLPWEHHFCPALRE